MIISFDVQGMPGVNAFLERVQIPRLEALGSRILDEAGIPLLNRTRIRFLAEQGPNAPWVPSRAGVQRRLLGGTGTLYKTGRLFRSIQWARETPLKRLLGTDVEYAGYLQYGTSKMVARPFVGFNDDDADVVREVVRTRINEYLGF